MPKKISQWCESLINTNPLWGMLLQGQCGIRILHLLPNMPFLFHASKNQFDWRISINDTYKQVVYNNENQFHIHFLHYLPYISQVIYFGMMKFSSWRTQNNVWCSSETSICTCKCHTVNFKNTSIHKGGRGHGKRPSQRHKGDVPLSCWGIMTFNYTAISIYIHNWTERKRHG